MVNFLLAYQADSKIKAVFIYPGKINYPHKINEVGI